MNFGTNQVDATPLSLEQATTETQILLRLQKQNRLLVTLLLSCASIYLFGFTQIRPSSTADKRQESVSDTIRTRKLFIVDNSGKEVGEFSTENGKTSLSIKDDTGIQKVNLEYSKSGLRTAASFINGSNSWGLTVGGKDLNSGLFRNVVVQTAVAKDPLAASPIIMHHVLTGVMQSGQFTITNQNNSEFHVQVIGKNRESKMHVQDKSCQNNIPKNIYKTP